MDNYDRQILSLDDTELERFTREWIGHKTQTYHEVTRFSGAGDLGRDVVGFYSPARHEGEWDNYQCKQYGTTLSTAKGLEELGKILYYAHEGNFTAPHKYFFVVPRGLNRNLEKMVFNPSSLREALISKWDDYCATNIIDGKTITLDAGLKAFLENYDFSRIARLGLDDILIDPYVRPVLTRWFGADPGPAPRGEVPMGIQDLELPYIDQLIKAYADRDRRTYANHSEIESHPTHGLHLARQRERFYDADAFKRFYRDNTDKEVLETLEDDIYHGVVDVCEAAHPDGLACVDAVMAHASKLSVSGPLTPHTRIPVKQGLCHHFANENRLRWRR